MKELKYIGIAVAIFLLWQIGVEFNNNSATNKLKAETLKCLNNVEVCRDTNRRLYDKVFEDTDMSLEDTNVSDEDIVDNIMDEVDPGAIPEYPTHDVKKIDIKELNEVVDRHSKNIVYDYLKALDVAVDGLANPVNSIGLYTVTEYKDGDIVIFSYSSKRYSGIIDNDTIYYNDSYDLEYIDVSSAHITNIKRVIEDVSDSKFAKYTAIMESNDRHIVTKYYYGRYQIAKKYIGYYVKRLNVKANVKKPSSKVERKIIYLIRKDSVKFLRKHKTPVNAYTLRMVYMLGRGNFLKLQKGTLPINIIRDNLPNSMVANVSNLRKYWQKKVNEIYTRLS